MGGGRCHNLEQGQKLGLLPYLMFPGFVAVFLFFNTGWTVTT